MFNFLRKKEVEIESKRTDYKQISIDIEKICKFVNNNFTINKFTGLTSDQIEDVKRLCKEKNLRHKPIINILNCL